MPRRPRVAFFLGIAISLDGPAGRAGGQGQPGLALADARGRRRPESADAQAASIGHGWGEEISSHAEIERYLRALTAAAPDRTRLVQIRRDDREARALPIW